MNNKRKELIEKFALIEGHLLKMRTQGVSTSETEKFINYAHSKMILPIDEFRKLINVLDQEFGRVSAPCSEISALILKNQSIINLICPDLSLN